ncbi:MAG TPA: nickel-dependent lactate racemase [Longilinea sp.]|nr:nickel-dependent lactate racemase [Longilinea sp.]
MQKFTLPYGSSTLSFELPPGLSVDLIEPVTTPPVPDPLAEVTRALDHPLNDWQWRPFKPTQAIGIAINDKTRPVPHQHLLPPLLKKLIEMGASADKINFFVATGTHLPLGFEEFTKILPKEIVDHYHIESHNCDEIGNLFYLGVTQRQTPVYVNKRFNDMDFKIVVGNIEPHHFAGFSGGVKTAAIGLVGRQTINANHVMLREAMATIAEYENNPLRQDIEEIGAKIGIDLAVNAVLNADKQIVKVFAGDPKAVMLAGIPVSRAVCQKAVPQRYDVVIASVGGHPKDINLYQSQKALTHASLLTKDGGTVILVAACPEGSGSKPYEAFMEGIQTPDQVFLKFEQEGFKVGPHKAFQIARELKRIHVILISQIPDELVKKLLLIPEHNVIEALKQVSPALDGMSIAVMPHATNTIPDIA